MVRITGMLTQPPAVNESAIQGVPSVCRILAGAEMQKGYTEVQPCYYAICNQFLVVNAAVCHYSLDYRLVN
ncbi:hypothetical protein D3C80_1402470 [compost metagenome]